MAVNDDVEDLKAKLIALLEPLGVAPHRLQVAYQDDLQDYDILIGGGTLTDEQIADVDQATRSRGCLRFSNRANDQKLHQMHAREGRLLMKAQAVELRALHPDLPTFDPASQSLNDFVRKLETWFGFEPGAALQVMDDGSVMTKSRDPSFDFSSAQKLMNALTILSAEDVSVLILGRSV